MKKGKYNFLIDSSWGSSGKGAVTTRLVDRYNVENAASNNYPNAGHTAVIGEISFISKALPTPSILNKFDKKVTSWVGPGSGFEIAQIEKEMKECDLIGGENLFVHERAMIVTPDHIKSESPEGELSTEHISSTMSGSGAAQSSKIMRGKDVVMAKNFDNLGTLKPWDFAFSIRNKMESGETFLHEVSQGFALSIDYGTHYPHCLSYNSKILMADGSTKKIIDLVREKSEEKVLCRNKNGEMIESKICNWFENDYDGDWYNIVTDTSEYSNYTESYYGGRFTYNHNIELSNGEVKEARYIKEGDELITNELKLVGDSLQVFIGSILGDGCIYKSNDVNVKTNRFSFQHSEKQKNYCKSKFDVMFPIIGGNFRDGVYGDDSFKPGNKWYRYESDETHQIYKISKDLGFLDDKNLMNVDSIVDIMDWKAIAIWYQDDGRYKKSKNGDEVIFYTNGFSGDVCDKLSESIKNKFNIELTVNKCGEYNTLRLSRYDHQIFFNNIKDYIHEDLKYKIPEEYEVCWSFKNNDKKVFGSVSVLKNEIVTFTKYNNKCFNIEVDQEDHNYFVMDGKRAFNVKNCTSRDTSVQQTVAYMGLLPEHIGDVYLNVRSLPIRVGNNFRDGKQTGYSGDWMSDQKELTWSEVAESAEMPEYMKEQLLLNEKTTVTKKVRRVATQSWDLLRISAKFSGATKMVLNFPQYIHWSCHKVRGGVEEFNNLHPKVKDYVGKMESVTGLKVVAICTGADHEDVIWLD